MRRGSRDLERSLLPTSLPEPASTLPEKEKRDCYALLIRERIRGGQDNPNLNLLEMKTWGLGYQRTFPVLEIFVFGDT